MLFTIGIVCSLMEYPVKNQLGEMGKFTKKESCFKKQK